MDEEEAARLLRQLSMPHGNHGFDVLLASIHLADTPAALREPVNDRRPAPGPLDLMGAPE